LHREEERKKEGLSGDEEREAKREDDEVASQYAYAPSGKQIPIPVPGVGRGRREAAEEGIIDECVGGIAQKIRRIEERSPAWTRWDTISSYIMSSMRMNIPYEHTHTFTRV
jgi:hypothetical protein